jgi:uncharacterized protein
MTLTVMRSLFSVIVLGSLGAFSAAAQTAPSFDCHKATNATERRICTDPELAQLDRHLATLWRSTIRSFQDDQQSSQIRADQKEWIAQRNECADDSKCIAGHYQKEIARLNGEDPEYPATGVFEAAGTGTLSLYPHSGEYLISIQTAEPNSGKWTCEVSGTAKKEGDGLRVTSEDLSFPVSIRDPRTMIVAQNREVGAVARQQCGLNGTFAFTFTRRAAKETPRH